MANMPTKRRTTAAALMTAALASGIGLSTAGTAVADRDLSATAPEVATPAAQPEDVRPELATGAPATPPTGAQSRDVGAKGWRDSGTHVKESVSWLNMRSGAGVWSNVIDGARGGNGVDVGCKVVDRGYTWLYGRYWGGHVWGYIAQPYALLPSPAVPDC